MPVLEETRDGLEDDDSADDNETNDHMGTHRMVEVVYVVTDSDPQGHAADHHNEAYHLDRGVHYHCLIHKITIL